MNEIDILVVGAGIAGLNAGLSAARIGRSVQVVTGPNLGGHLLSIERIEGFPGFADTVAGYDLCPTVQEQAEAAGAQIMAAEVREISASADRWRVTTDSEGFVARAVILASGTKLKQLGVPGEADFIGRGISHCASCDAPLLRGKRVAVIGGGDSACQEALTLAEHLDKVLIFHHGEALSAQKSFTERVEASKRILVRGNAAVAAILGKDGVTGIRLASGEEIGLEAVFIFCGLVPAIGFRCSGLERDDSGRPLTDGALRTNLRGILAAGTVRAGSVGRAVAAAGEGAFAAIMADKFLRDTIWR